MASDRFFDIEGKMLNILRLVQTHILLSFPGIIYGLMMDVAFIKVFTG